MTSTKSAESQHAAVERLTKALEAVGITEWSAEVIGDDFGKITTTDVRIPFEDHEEIVVNLDDPDWAYFITVVVWSHGTRETAPDATEGELGLVGDPELAAALVKAAIDMRRRKLVEQAKDADEVLAILRRGQRRYAQLRERGTVDQDAWIETVDQVQLERRLAKEPGEQA